MDVGLATLMVKLAAQNKYDRLILSAGDGDFEDAIKYVKYECAKEVWVTGHSASLSTNLRGHADRVIRLEDHRREIEKTRFYAYGDSHDWGTGSFADSAAIGRRAV